MNAAAPVDFEAMGARPLTDQERTGLKGLPGRSGSIARMLGFMILFFNALFLLTEPPKEPEIFYGFNLALVIVGFALAGENRRHRALAAGAIAAGTAWEARAVARTRGGQSRVLDLGGARIRPAANDRKVAGLLASGAVLNIAYSGPFPQPQSPAVLLLSVNGVSLGRPAICTWVTNPGTR